MTIAIAGRDQESWKNWLEGELVPFQPFLHHLNPGEHDRITTISQLIHMVTAFMVGTAWQKIPSRLVNQGINIGGPPCRLLVRSVLRTVSSGKVISSILLNHPFTLDLIASLRQSLEKLGDVIVERNMLSLETMLDATRDVIDPQNLKSWDTSTNQLARLEADMQRTTVIFHFAVQQNRIGLLAKVLHEFDIRGIDKTSTIAQVTSDGGCTIMIGVKENSSAVREAEMEIKKWI